MIWIFVVAYLLIGVLLLKSTRAADALYMLGYAHPAVSYPLAVAIILLWPIRRWVILFFAFFFD